MKGLPLEKMKNSLNNNQKITLFISSLSTGGAERVTCNLANYLFRNGCIVDVITMSNRNDTYALDEGITRVCLLDEKERSGKIKDFLVRRKRLKDYVVKNQNVSCYIVMLPVTIFMLIRLKKFTQSKIIISERVNPASYGLIKKIMVKYSAKRCDGLVVQTKEISDWYKNVKNKIIIQNAINEDVILPKRGRVEKRIVAVGRLEKQKNYPMLIRAFSAFNKNHPGYKLEIYGHGSEEKKLRRMVEKYGLSNKIIFMGYTKNVSEKIANAACFVMTSNYEGISNALIEAMCIGLPCVSTDSDGGGARELIENGKNGFLIKKNAVEDLVKTLNIIITEGGIVTEVSENAKKIKNTLASENIYREWLVFINSVEAEH